MTCRVSVIIPVLNEQATIARAARSAWTAGAAEVIVVDGGSEDKTQHLAAQLGCQVIESPPGRAIQQNIGATTATGEILLFQHADCWLAEDCLRQLKQAVEHDTSCRFGAFRQTIDPASSVYLLLAAGNAARVRWLRLAYGDQGIFVTRSLFNQVGGFAAVPLMEDVILMRSLRRWGRPVLLPGPLHVSARRWQHQGLIRQTARNWCLLTAFFCGVSPERLAHHYPRHDRLPAGRQRHQPS